MDLLAVGLGNQHRGGLLARRVDVGESGRFRVGRLRPVTINLDKFCGQNPTEIRPSEGGVADAVWAAA